MALSFLPKRDKTTVYHLEDRGQDAIMHWFLFVVAGLRDLNHLPKPVYYTVKINEQFQRETIDLLKPDFVFVADTTGLKVVSHFGAPLEKVCYVPRPYYSFVRELVLSRGLATADNPTRLLYISRSRAHLLPVNQTARRRDVLNEQAVVNALVSIGFEVIYLEDYALVDKIRLFQTAKTIVTPSGGALTMCFFANQKTRIIEIIGADSQNEDQYYHICEVLSIPIVRYTNVRSLDQNGNITVPKLCGFYNIEVPDIDDLVTFVVAQKDL